MKQTHVVERENSPLYLQNMEKGVAYLLATLLSHLTQSLLYLHISFACSCFLPPQVFACFLGFSFFFSAIFFGYARKQEEHCHHCLHLSPCLVLFRRMMLHPPPLFFFVLGVIFLSPFCSYIFYPSFYTVLHLLSSLLRPLLNFSSFCEPSSMSFFHPPILFLVFFVTFM